MLGHAILTTTQFILITDAGLRISQSSTGKSISSLLAIILPNVSFVSAQFPLILRYPFRFQHLQMLLIRYQKGLQEMLHVKQDTLVFFWVFNTSLSNAA